MKRQLGPILVVMALFCAPMVWAQSSSNDSSQQSGSTDSSQSGSTGSTQGSSSGSIAEWFD